MGLFDSGLTARVARTAFVVLTFVAVRSVPALADEVAGAPVPLLAKGQPVDWWFAFKFDGETFPGCDDEADAACPFGGSLQKYSTPEGEQFVIASSDQPELQMTNTCLGQGDDDPLGATFEEVYLGSFFYVIWNDALFGDPVVDGCHATCSAPWGLSKGLLAWDESGNGFVLQVTTPSWPGAGSRRHPRAADGNTLGCVKENNVARSQHFFALRLDRDDLIHVLEALKNASVVTSPQNPQLVKNGGPRDIASLVAQLGSKSNSTETITQKLSSGVVLVSKPSALHVPPWQLVSALLEGTPLRVASWWGSAYIPTTTAATKVGCWSDSLGKPGPVEIATSGQWGQAVVDLKPKANRANLGVAASGTKQLTIFGDLNQEGALSGYDCGMGNNARGGLFYAVENEKLFESVAHLLQGETASATPLKKSQTRQRRNFTAKDGRHSSAASTKRSRSVGSRAQPDANSRIAPSP
jgi:hypothetical protein